MTIRHGYFYTLDEKINAALLQNRKLKLGEVLVPYYRGLIYCCDQWTGKRGLLESVDQAKDVVVGEYVFPLQMHPKILEMIDRIIPLYTSQSVHIKFQMINDKKKTFTAVQNAPLSQPDLSIDFLKSFTDITLVFKTLGRRNKKVLTLEDTRIRYGTEEIFSRRSDELVVVTTKYTAWIDLPSLRWKDGHLLTDGKLSLTDEGLEGRLSLSREEGQLSVADEGLPKNT